MIFTVHIDVYTAWGKASLKLLAQSSKLIPILTKQKQNNIDY